MVHREYRFPSHPPSRSEDPQLQFTQGISREPHLSRQAIDVAFQPEMPQMASLRRSQPQAGWLGCLETISSETYVCIKSKSDLQQVALFISGHIP